MQAARAMLAAIAAERPQAHLLLGSDALALVRGQLSALADEFRRWEALTLSTDG